VPGQVVKAVAYTRVSSPGQATPDKVSLGEQERDIATYCQQKDYQLAGRYQDAGFSGASKLRPGFQQMLKDAASGKFDVIVAWKTDRLSRGMYPAAALMEAIEGTEVRIECVKDMIDLKTLALYAAVGKMELDNLKERVRMGHHGRAMKGKPNNIVAYGYTRNEQGFPIEDYEASKVVKRIFYHYVNGIPLHVIADGLNREGIPTKKGKAWTRNMVSVVISNSAYIGKGYYGRRQVVKRDKDTGPKFKVTVRPQEEWIEIPFPPLVTQEVWDAAQDRFKKNAHLRARTGESKDIPFLLRGLAWCGHCGTRYMPNYGHRNKRHVKADGTVAVYRKAERRYICYAGITHKSDCPQTRRGARKLETAVWDTIVSFIERPETLKAVLGERRKGLQEQGGWDEMEKARQLLAQVEQEEQRAVTAYVKGWIDEKGLALQRKFIVEHKERAQEAVKRLEAQVSNLDRNLACLDAFERVAADICQRIKDMTPDEQAELVNIVVDRVVVDGDRVQVVLTFDLPQATDGFESNLGRVVPTVSKSSTRTSGPWARPRTQPPFSTAPPGTTPLFWKR